MGRLWLRVWEVEGCRYNSGIGQPRRVRIGPATDCESVRNGGSIGAALGEALYAVGDDDGAGRAFGEAAGVIRDVAHGLAAERANRLLAAPQVAEIMTAGR